MFSVRSPLQYTVGSIESVLSEPEFSHLAIQYSTAAAWNRGPQPFKVPRRSKWNLTCSDSGIPIIDSKCILKVYTLCTLVNKVLVTLSKCPVHSTSLPVEWKNTFKVFLPALTVKVTTNFSGAQLRSSSPRDSIQKRKNEMKREQGRHGQCLATSKATTAAALRNISPRSSRQVP